jgi:hypothetical protein
MKRVGEVWQYRDDMNQQARWVDLGTGWQDPFASWDLYFDNHGRYVGWRLIEPLNAQGRARERFVTSDASDLFNNRWDRKVEDILERLQDCLADSTRDPADLQQDCRLVSADLRLVPQNYRHKESLNNMTWYCDYLARLPITGVAAQAFEIPPRGSRVLGVGTGGSAQGEFQLARGNCYMVARIVLDKVD